MAAEECLNEWYYEDSQQICVPCRSLCSIDSIVVVEQTCCAALQMCQGGFPRLASGCAKREKNSFEIFDYLSNTVSYDDKFIVDSELISQTQSSSWIMLIIMISLIILVACYMVLLLLIMNHYRKRFCQGENNENESGKPKEDRIDLLSNACSARMCGSCSLLRECFTSDEPSTVSEAKYNALSSNCIETSSCVSDGSDVPEGWNGNTATDPVWIKCNSVKRPNLGNSVTTRTDDECIILIKSDSEDNLISEQNFSSAGDSAWIENDSVKCLEDNTIVGETGTVNNLIKSDLLESLENNLITMSTVTQNNPLNYTKSASCCQNDSVKTINRVTILHVVTFKCLMLSTKLSITVVIEFYSDDDNSDEFFITKSTTTHSIDDGDDKSITSEQNAYCPSKLLDSDYIALRSSTKRNLIEPASSTDRSSHMTTTSHLAQNVSTVSYYCSISDQISTAYELNHRAGPLATQSKDLNNNKIEDLLSVNNDEALYSTIIDNGLCSVENKKVSTVSISNTSHSASSSDIDFNDETFTSDVDIVTSSQKIDRLSPKLPDSGHCNLSSMSGCDRNLAKFNITTVSTSILLIRSESTSSIFNSTTSLVSMKTAFKKPAGYLLATAPTPTESLESITSLDAPLFKSSSEKVTRTFGKTMKAPFKASMKAIRSINRGTIRKATRVRSWVGSLFKSSSAVNISKLWSTEPLALMYQMTSTNAYNSLLSIDSLQVRSTESLIKLTNIGSSNKSMESLCFRSTEVPVKASFSQHTAEIPRIQWTESHVKKTSPSLLSTEPSPSDSGVEMQSSRLSNEQQMQLRLAELHYISSQNDMTHTLHIADLSVSLRNLTDRSTSLEALDNQVAQNEDALLKDSNRSNTSLSCRLETLTNNSASLFVTSSSSFQGLMETLVNEEMETIFNEHGRTVVDEDIERQQLSKYAERLNPEHFDSAQLLEELYKKQIVPYQPSSTSTTPFSTLSTKTEPASTVSASKKANKKVNVKENQLKQSKSSIQISKRYSQARPLGYQRRLERKLRKVEDFIEKHRIYRDTRDTALALLASEASINKSLATSSAFQLIQELSQAKTPSSLQSALRELLELAQSRNCVWVLEDFFRQSNLAIDFLTAACVSGSKKIVTRLTEDFKIDIDAQNLQGWTPLTATCASGSAVMVNWLINQTSANPNIANTDSQTPLIVACDKYQPDIIRLLLSDEFEQYIDADINIADVTARTALHYVIEHSKNQGRTLLHDLCLRGDVAGVRKIVYWLYNSEVNAQDNNGWTPLHLACMAGHVDIAKMLLWCGADVDARDDDWDTPNDLAEAAGNGFIVDLLKVKSSIDWCPAYFPFFLDIIDPIEVY